MFPDQVKGRQTTDYNPSIKMTMPFTDLGRE